MKVLLLWLMDEFQEYLINKFILAGIEIFVAESNIDALNKIDKKQITHIVINIDVKYEQAIELVKEINKKYADARKHIVIQTRKNDKPTIEQLVLLGISGLIFPRDEMQVNYKKIENILVDTGFSHDKREYFRIKPKPDDNLVINFPIPNYPALVTGSITDISVGGVAFKLKDPDESSLFREGQVLEKIQIILNGKRALARMQVLRRGPLTAAKFIDPSESFTTLLTHFIFERL